MKKEVLVFLLVIPLLISIVFAINAESSINESITNSSIITGKIVTGEATEAILAVSVSILALPTLTIIKPENKTYITNNNLLLHFSAGSEYEVWYNLDSGSNTTITGNTNFSTTSGTHTVFLYENNS